VSLSSISNKKSNVVDMIFLKITLKVQWSNLVLIMYPCANVEISIKPLKSTENSIKIRIN
jgi:hypothetical protein